MLFVRLGCREEGVDQTSRGMPASHGHSSCKSTSTVVCCLLDMVVGLGLGMLGMPASHAQSSCVYLFVSVVFTLITSLNKCPCYIISDDNADMLIVIKGEYND